MRASMSLCSVYGLNIDIQLGRLGLQICMNNRAVFISCYSFCSSMLLASCVDTLFCRLARKPWRSHVSSVCIMLCGQHQNIQSQSCQFLDNDAHFHVCVTVLWHPEHLTRHTVNAAT